MRCDVAAFIGFITRERWPQGARTGDFVTLQLRRPGPLLEYRVQDLFPENGPPPVDAGDFVSTLHQEQQDLLMDQTLGDLFDPATVFAARRFFENGGLSCHLFAVCIESPADLRVSGRGDGREKKIYEHLHYLLDHLRVEEDISLLAAPCVAWWPCRLERREEAGGLRDRVVSDADGLYDVLLAHCQEMTNRFLVIDTPMGLHGEGLLQWVTHLRERDRSNRSFGAVYYPWVRHGDDFAPPSGAIVGTYARVEREHDPYGVVWAPANVTVRGVGEPENRLNWSEARSLAAQGVNPLLIQAGRGLVLFGARTLSGEPEWEFINSRRIVSMIAEQLRRDNEWAVFEPNDQDLWRLLERDINIRLEEIWENGVLAGDKAGQEYWVRCDTETNTPENRQAGEVSVRVRLRPVTTTEQIAIELVLGDRTEVRTGGT